MRSRSLVIDGIDTYDDLRLVLESKVMKPPEPRFHLIDVPGRNGPIDATEALAGDVAFSSREFEFAFRAIDPSGFESLKTRLSNFLHGRRFDFQLSWDPGYTYSGRFAIVEYRIASRVGRIVMRVTADPYKSKGRMAYRLNACGGRMYRFECGRKPVQPVIECRTPTRVTFDGRTVMLGAGTFQLNDVLFTQGWNELYVNSFEVFATTWDDVAGYRWDDVGSMRWDEVCALGVDGGTVKATTWDDVAERRWSELSGKTWNDLKYQPADDGDYETYLTYEWSDL